METTDDGWYGICDFVHYSFGQGVMRFLAVQLYHDGEVSMYTTKETIDNLDSLIQLDIDAFNAYGQVIKEITVPSIKERLSRYREDHKTHISVLSKIVHSLKGEPPVFSADIKGFFIEGMTAIRAKIGIEGALKAMETNEKLTNDRYSKAAAWPVPQEILTTLEKNHYDERIHLAYIQEALEQRVWESK